MFFCLFVVVFFLSQQGTSLIGEAEAQSIALPLIKQYAKENNRTIESVNAFFYETKYVQDLRGNQTYPCWEINAKFIDSNHTAGKEDQFWIGGYDVGVWADTGEVCWSQISGRPIL